MKQQSGRIARRWMLLLASVASFMVALDALVVATALSTIRVRLGATLETLEWTVNAYTLSFAVLLLTGAALGDRFGRKRMFVIGLGIFTAASAACALAPSVDWLIAARATQGAGAALVLPLAVTLLSIAFPPEQRAKALGVLSGTAGLAVMCGPVMGGAITQGLDWQWIFWVNVPVGLAAIVCALVRIKESSGGSGALDFPGLFLATGGALGLVWGLVRGNNVGWGKFEVIGTLAAGVVLTLTFVAWEKRASLPMVPLKLFRQRIFSFGNMAAFFFFASLYSATFFLAQFLQTSLGYSPLGAGLRLLPWTVVLFVVAPFSGALANRIGARTLVVTGLLLQTTGLAWIAFIARPGLPYADMVLPLILAGGASMTIPTLQHTVIGAVAPDEIGQASGIFNTIRQLGAAFGVAIVAAVFAVGGGFASAQAFSSGFVPAMVICATLSLAGLGAGMVLPGQRKNIFSRRNKSNSYRDIPRGRSLK